MAQAPFSGHNTVPTHAEDSVSSLIAGSTGAFL